MTAPALRLSDLAGPDASGLSDVAVFVRADGRDEPNLPPFVVKSFFHFDGACMANIQHADGSQYERYADRYPVRRLGRGRLVPARIVMEGETPRPLTEEDAFDVYSLADELYRAKDDERPGIVKAIREILDNKPVGAMTLDESLERCKREKSTVTDAFREAADIEAATPIRLVSNGRYANVEAMQAALSEQSATAPTPTGDAK